MFLANRKKSAVGGGLCPSAALPHAPARIGKLSSGHDGPQALCQLSPTARFFFRDSDGLSFLRNFSLQVAVAARQGPIPP